ncbi:extracellular solute-binding protein [Paenibacillus crassostreae]|uniref:ABC transporter substrate-binding protein n=1 Tax=Paenibacillus crassostreae TaxID=1763538 RepID=A0A167EW15_9BACL|nr:extracellular solute-binding protein [Paenibacillus crassostreae]AOZ93413.1 ABC transporter substrate-binding protein [Paenibacillus crassostreae]OAB75933.1 ABC transporter substrate-binding protein [Paenibacillus crassostreae]
MEARNFGLLRMSWIAIVGLTIFTAGCFGGNSMEESSSTKIHTESTISGSNDPATTREPFEYPMQGLPELTLMTEFPDMGMPNEGPIDEEYEKRTGIAIRHLGGVPMQDNKFNYLLASGNLPDIFMNNWLQFPGGPEKAIQQGDIMPLNEVIDRYAPNFKRVLEDNPEIDKMVKTDSGIYYAFPFIRSEEGKVYGGPIIRKDWLDELKLPIPTTINEWYKTLKAFKDKKGATAPLTFRTLFLGERTAGFAGAFGVMGNFYVEDGKVIYGYLEPEYRDYLETMSKWYREGLIDKDFAVLDLESVDKKMSSGLSGATIGWFSYIEKYNLAALDNDSTARYTAAPYPTLREGEIPKFGQLDNAYAGTSSAAINATTKNLEAAVRWLDYGYSEEGSLLNTFGIEDVTYTMKNGHPVYTDLVVENSDGISSDQVMLQYAHQTNFPMIQRYSQLEWRFEETNQAIEVWRNTKHEDYLLPPITPTSEEASELSTLMDGIDEYVKDSELRIILGVDSIDAYDDMVNQLKLLGIERILEIKQAAYQRYVNR